VYRVDKESTEHIPRVGAAVLACCRVIFFSRHGDRTLTTFSRGWNARLSILSALPIRASQAAAEVLQRHVCCASRRVAMNTSVLR
jgi:hypothetical protein